MKRSFINTKIEETIVFFKKNNFYLPKWAMWSHIDWENIEFNVEHIVNNGLGWDITDFGYNDFSTKGLSLFTLRNGLYTPDRKPYCEKIMHVRKGQLTPYHYHADKIEDIIFRGGQGRFFLSLLPTDKNRKPIENHNVEVEIDGQFNVFKSGEKIELELGQSITLPPYLYHKFWAEEADCLIGEVSTINNDMVDNYFLEELGRYSTIIEDELSQFILCNEYNKK